MKWNILIFIAGFVVAFAGGYLFMGMDDSTAATDQPESSANETETKSEEAGENEAKEEETPDETEAVATGEGEALQANNCLSCHAVESLDLQGGTTGPDLSDAYTTVEDKHGKPVEEFLQEPTSAVMSTVISGNPLPDEEREKIVEALKKASEQGK